MLTMSDFNKDRVRLKFRKLTKKDIPIWSNSLLIMID